MGVNHGEAKLSNYSEENITYSFSSVCVEKTRAALHGDTTATSNRVEMESTISQYPQPFANSAAAGHADIAGC